MQQRLGAAPLAQQRQGLRELHLVIDLGEANHVTAAATAVAVEKVFVGIHQEAWFVISMQRTQPHPSATAERPRRAPIMRLQIAHQGNLLFQVVESLAIHGLLASMGRIRQSAPKSQARMVGARKKCWPTAPAFTQRNTQSRRRCAHRRRVDGSGERDGSLQSGAACSTEAPAAICSHPSSWQRQLSATQAESRRRRQPIGQDREGLVARPTESAPHPNAFVPVVVGLTEPPSMTDDRVVPANRTSPRQEVQGDHPGSMLSFASGSAIKRITAGVRARRWFSLPGLLRRPAFTLLVYSLSNEKRKLLSVD